MERMLELFADGSIVEMDGEQPIKLARTQGEVKALADFLRFSRAKTYRLAPADRLPPTDVPQPRGGQSINPAGLKLITTFEGRELAAYQDSVGVWTIGYGHTKTVRPGMTITQAEAEQLLQTDLEEFEAAVTDAVAIDLNSDQFSALVSFCFNLGAGSLFESTLLQLLNNGDIEAAAHEFPRWNKAGGQALLGLTRRRLAERALFLSQPWEAFLTYEGDGTEIKPLGGPRVLKLTNPIMQGEDVRRVQAALLKAGFDLGPDGADGAFGKATDQAIQQLQRQKQLTVDGIVGAQTLRALGL